MKTFVITLLTGFLIINGVKSQTPTEKTYGTKHTDEIVGSIHLGDSSVITFMNKYKDDSSAVSIFKSGKDDSPKWTQTTGFSDCRINSAIQTADGNIAFAGYVLRSNQEYRRKKAWIAKIDTAGNIMWNRIFNFGTNAEAAAIIQLPDSSLFITGLGNVQSEPDYRIVALHVDQNGNEIKTYSHYQSYYNFASDAIFCHDSTIMIVGVERSPQPKLLLANFNLNGEVQWNKVLACDQCPPFLIANAVTRDESNNYYITGNTEHGILCMKLNADFNLEWSMEYKISENMHPSGEDIICLNDSIVIIVGSSEDKDINYVGFPRPPGDIVVIGINPQGDTLWTSSIGSPADEYVVSMNKVSDSLVFLNGSSYGLATEGDYDGYRIGFVPGKPACHFSHTDFIIDTIAFAETEGIEMGTGLIAADSTITWMTDTIGFHDACICQPPDALYSWHVYEGSIAVTNLSSWATDWTWNIGSGQQREEYHLELTGNNINLCLSVANECGSDEYCEIVDDGGVGVLEINQVSLEAFPVPSSDKVQLQFEITEGFPDIRVFDATGKQVGMFPRYTQNTLTLSKQETGNGLFFVVFMLDSKVIAMKKIIFE